MALPALTGNPPANYFDRFPSFCVVGGTMLHRLGGVTWPFWGVGSEVQYRQHGKIKVTQVKADSGQIEVTLPSGERHKVAVPPNTRVTVINGQKHVQSLVPLVKEMKSEPKLGFVCPEWARPYWDSKECTVLKCTDGNYAVLDHSMQCTIYVGRTYDECCRWLAGDNIVETNDAAYDLDRPYESMRGSAA